MVLSLPNVSCSFSPPLKDVPPEFALGSLSFSPSTSTTPSTSWSSLFSSSCGLKSSPLGGQSLDPPLTPPRARPLPIQNLSTSQSKLTTLKLLPSSRHLQDVHELHLCLSVWLCSPSPKRAKFSFPFFQQTCSEQLPHTCSG